VIYACSGGGKISPVYLMATVCVHIHDESRYGNDALFTESEDKAAGICTHECSKVHFFDKERG